MLPVCRCSFYFGLFLIFLLQLLDFLIINELLIGLWFCRLNKTFVFYQYVTCSMYAMYAISLDSSELQSGWVMGV